MRFDATDQRQPSRRLWTPRLVATLALFAVSAVFFCAIAGLVLVRQADDRQGLERRAALLGAIENIRSAGANLRALTPAHIKEVERIVGLKDLQFEIEPAGGNREIQSVLDGQGRIVGWFSWEPDASMSRALGRLRPLLALTWVFLVGFAVIALWQVRRAVRGLAASERLAWRLAYEDTLTGLPNHRKMLEQIDAALAARKPGETVTLAVLDLDCLKDVNDALGHRAGDDYLIALAGRMRAVLPPRALCGRFDGDEFVLAMTSADAATAETAIADFAGQLARPFWIKHQAVHVGITVGLAHTPDDAASRDELLRCADLALRAAKRIQRGGMRRFESGLEVEFDEQRFLEMELRRALDDKALDVHYQAIVSADGNRVTGAEALLRWTHPMRGPIPPANFVPVAEQCGLMPRLGAFVLRRAVADAARWPGLPVAVNVSPVQMRDPALVETVKAVLDEYGLPPDRLVLEMTEGVLVDNPDEAKLRLDALKSLGVRLALDDFGTGYSSLTYLRRFDFDKLKIDKGFVDPLGTSAESQAMLQAIVALGRALGLTLVAEGVETEEQRVLLRLAGCSEMQGYLFARPGPREALDRLLAQPRAVA